MRMNWIERFRGHSQAWIATAVVACPIAVAMGATSLRAMLVQEGSAASSVGGTARASEGDEASGIGSSSGGVATLVGEIAPASPVSPLDIAQEPSPASQPRGARTIGGAQPNLRPTRNKFDDPVVGWATAPSMPQGALPPNPPMAPSGNVAGFAPYSSYQVANFYHAPTSPEDQKTEPKIDAAGSTLARTRFG